MTTESRLPEIVAACDEFEDAWRALRWVREVIAGPRILVIEHELPRDDVPEARRYCLGTGRGGTETTDGGPHDDCAACSGTGVAATRP